MPIQVLHREINGIDRTVVLFGEVHLQDRWTFDVGKGVVDAFPDRALEGYPGGPAWKAFLSAAYFVEGVFLGKLAGSNISYAKQKAAVDARLAKLAQKLIEKHGVMDMTEEERVQLRVRHWGREFTGPELMDLSRGLLDNGAIPLEKGFQPTLSDTATTWGIPTVYLANRFSLAPALGIVHSLFHASLEGAEAWGVATAATFLSATFAHIAWLPTAGDALTPRRDAHMSQSIRDYLVAHDDKKVLLVVVGKNHVGGISRELEKEGFGSLRLPLAQGR